MKLRGKINQCPSCGAYFSTVSNFDMHRVGAFSTGLLNTSPERRCLSVSEMVNVGLTADARGVFKDQSSPGYHQSHPKRSTRVAKST